MEPDDEGQIEQQDAETGEWSDETAEETAAADAEGTPVAPVEVENEGDDEPVSEGPAADEFGNMPADPGKEDWFTTHRYPPPE